MPDSSSVEEVKATQATEESAEAEGVKDSAEAPAAGEVEASSKEGGEAKDEKPKSMLDAVKDAIKAPEAKTEKTEDGEASDPEGDGKEKPESKSDDGKVPKKDEKVPFHNHPRWKEMIAKQRSLQGSVENLTAEVENFRQFQSTVRQAGLSAQDVDTGFEIMRLMKHDPAAAYVKLQPFLEQLQHFTGERLPADLQQKVEAGLVDTDTARELARTRAGKQHVETRVAQDAESRRVQAEQDAAARQQAELKTHMEACATAVSSWENQWKKDDPDYAKKQPLVDAMVVKMLQERDTRGQPVHVIGNPEDAVNLTKKAREEVERTLGPVLARRDARRTVTGGAPAAQAAPQPKTLLEAVKAAARR